MEQLNEAKYKVINPGTDIHNKVFTGEEICIAASINPKAPGALQFAMASFWGFRFERVDDP